MKPAIKPNPSVPRARASAKAADSSDTRKPRSDGAEARSRLLLAALRLFAEKGFAKTSTREIAQAAGVNLAAIKYYFGDKAGLYRVVFSEPLGTACESVDLSDPTLSLRDVLRIFFEDFVAPLKHGDVVQLAVRMHYREMLEPTGLWMEEIDNHIKPSHAGLVAVLLRHLNLSKADDDVHRLAFSLAGLALQLFICQDVIDAIRPKLINTPSAVDQWATRLVDYGEAMVAMEIARRQTLAGAIAPAPFAKKAKKL
nr:CerR family C-terminal domain-containing protein [Herminiimonas fonticola]